MRSEDGKYWARLVICPVDNEERLIVQALEQSLIAEAKSPTDVERIRVDVRGLNACTQITFSTDTLSHLRAVINSFLYLIHSAVKSIELALRKTDQYRD
ncbi:MAG TPA: hypothetical protein EYP48_03380 [Ignisphaera sp.]|uniref:KEOPS complex Pcc1-like subunit n=1 Tax=Ignisphaera aggregans TaxID=334771 RepID=A0A832YRW3_9CREN|nr:hypothetical protein [Ignisphaera sp.]HIP56595.1 hypothetical protein [Ignisphaera aggregans]